MHFWTCREYKENIDVVDKRIGEFVKIIDDFYDNDNKTAFVFTADHGMTDWGLCRLTT